MKRLIVKNKLLLAILILPLFSSAKKQPSFMDLIKETNQYLEAYENVWPSYNEYYSVKELSFLKSEIKNIADSEYNTGNGVLNAEQDSVESFFVSIWLQEKIMENLKMLAAHKDFINYDIANLLKSNEINIAVSNDKKLYNFSIDEKSGGSYRSRLSTTHYIKTAPNNAGFQSIDVSESDSFIFPRDGLDHIYTIETIEGTKYILSTTVRFCNTCFYSSIYLVSYRNDAFVEEFRYSVESRDPESGVWYEPENQVVYVDYFVDDLNKDDHITEIFKEEEYNDMHIKHERSYIFNGKTFDLMKYSWEKTKH